LLWFLWHFWPVVLSEVERKHNNFSEINITIVGAIGSISRTVSLFLAAEKKIKNYCEKIDKISKKMLIYILTGDVFLLEIVL